ncbi:MAG: hypothetical protein DWH99_07435 [Planctomycetota bacterium]|nr:MAG: hypothetical protein DWH99_07435 [Planctomycetota bacterium]
MTKNSTEMDGTMATVGVQAIGDVMRVLIVDDGFDPPELAEIAANDFDQFIAELNSSESQHELLSGIATIDDLNAENIKQLWTLRFEDPNFRLPLDALFAHRLQSYSAVIAIYDVLVAKLGGKCVAYDGTSCSYVGQYDVVFLDYRLGTGDENTAVRSAVQLARKIHSSTGAMVVLMSSTDVSESKVCDFRKNADLHQSLFEFIDKSTLRDDRKLLNRLQALKDTHKSRRAIHDLVSSVEIAMKQAASKVSEIIKSVRFEDLTYLHYTTLRADGETLGDYIAWLVTNYSAHQLHAIIGGCGPIAELNEVQTRRLIPFQRRPTDVIAEMYRDAITEIIQRSWQRHPHADGTGVEGLPRLQFGDLLYKTATDPAYLILNAACDLAMAPGQSRGEDPDLSILLLPGIFVCLDVPWDKEWRGARTELFEIDDAPYRIRWEYSRVESVPFKQVRERFESQNYRHERRLTQAYAIEIQQSFSKELTRVGQQTPPPKLGGIGCAKLYFKSEERKFEHLGDFIGDAACVYHHKDKTTFTLTGACVEWVYENISKAISLIKGRVNDTSEGDPKKRLEELQAVKLGLLPDCGFQVEYTKLPSSGKFVVWPVKTDQTTPLLAVHHADSLSGSWKGDAVVALSISIEPSMQGNEE